MKSKHPMRKIGPAHLPEVYNSPNEDIRVIGSFISDKDISVRSLSVIGPTVSKGRIKAENLKVTGPFQSDFIVDIDQIKVTGPMTVNENLFSNTCTVTGPLSTKGDVNTKEYLKVHGDITANNIRGKVVHLLGGVKEVEHIEASEEIIIHLREHGSSIKTLKAPTIQIERKERKGIWGLLFRLFRRGQLTESLKLEALIEADSILIGEGIDLTGEVTSDLISSIDDQTYISGPNKDNTDE